MEITIVDNKLKQSWVRYLKKCEKNGVEPETFDVFFKKYLKRSAIRKKGKFLNKEERKERNRTVSREYYYANKELLSQKAKLYRKEHLEDVRERNKKWYENLKKNKEKYELFKEKHRRASLKKYHSKETRKKIECLSEEELLELKKHRKRLRVIFEREHPEVVYEHYCRRCRKNGNEPTISKEDYIKRVLERTTKEDAFELIDKDKIIYSFDEAKFIFNVKPLLMPNTIEEYKMKKRIYDYFLGVAKRKGYTYNLDGIRCFLREHFATEYETLQKNS